MKNEHTTTVKDYMRIHLTVLKSTLRTQDFNIDCFKKKHSLLSLNQCDFRSAG